MYKIFFWNYFASVTYYKISLSSCVVSMESPIKIISLGYEHYNTFVNFTYSESSTKL